MEKQEKDKNLSLESMNKYSWQTIQAKEIPFRLDIQNSSDLNHIDHASEAKSADATIPKYRNRGTVDELPKELGNLVSSEEALQKEFGKSMSSQAAIPDQPMSSEEALPNKLRKLLSTKEALLRELGTSMSFGEAPPKELGTPMTTYGSIGTDLTEKQNS
ncbi:hypothetical protein ACFX2G_022233 [Malus domestica]